MCWYTIVLLFIPYFRVDREANKDIRINDVEIPKGMLVNVPIYAIHHDPKIWPEPDKFNPYRFTPEEKAKHNPYDWIPFGAGPRNCLAMRLALTEFKIAIVYLIRKYKFVRTEKTEVSKLAYFFKHQILNYYFQTSHCIPFIIIRDMIHSPSPQILAKYEPRDSFSVKRSRKCIISTFA